MDLCDCTSYGHGHCTVLHQDDEAVTHGEELIETVLASNSHLRPRCLRLFEAVGVICPPSNHANWSPQCVAESCSFFVVACGTKIYSVVVWPAPSRNFSQSSNHRIVYARPSPQDCQSHLAQACPRGAASHRRCPGHTTCSSADLAPIKDKSTFNLV